MQEKKRIISNKILSSKLLLVVSVLILLFFSTNLIRQIINRRDLQKDIAELESEINSLEKKNQELSNLIGYFESLDFVEKEARTKLNLRKPGEKIIVVPEEGVAPEQTQESLEEDAVLVYQSEVDGSNPQRWLNYFFPLK